MSLSIKAARSRGGVSPVMRHRMGDPGLGSFLKKVGKGIVGGAVGLITGGPAGAVSGALGGLTSNGNGNGGAPAAPAALVAPRNGGGFQVPLPSGPGQPSSPVVPTPGLRGAVQRFVPGGATGLEVQHQNGTVACPRGFHPNKSDYFLRDGTFVAAGSRCVKNRRRNPLNPRALRSALARVDSGKTWQAKLREIETGRYTKAGTKKSC